MQKQAPSVGRLLVMTLFVLSCFGLLLFLWLSFGGAVPLKPKGYRFRVAFPQATQLALQADVRIAGVSVGKVVGKDLDRTANRTLATVELKPRFSPIRDDARAILRQKTLLGETYVELTPGTRSARALPDGGRLANGQVADSVQLDQILNALDPQTRRAFQTWQQDLGRAIDGRGQDLNDAFGNLPGFAASGSDLLQVLDIQHQAVSRLIRNTGQVFGALSQDERALHNLVTGSEATFSATASRNEQLAEAFHIFPTFLDESRKTLARLESFSTDTDPLVRELQPAIRDLTPTLRNTRAFSPDLKRLFLNLKPLIRVSRTGLPALQQTLEGLRPLLGNLGPFLSELNPILEWLGYNQHEIADFISQGAAAVSNTTVSNSGGQGHYLRQFGPVGPETVAMYPNRPATNRGNTYMNQLALQGQNTADFLMFPNWDCRNAGGEKKPTASTAGCWVRGPTPFEGQSRQFPHVDKSDYSK